MIGRRGRGSRVKIAIVLQARARGFPHGVHMPEQGRARWESPRRTIGAAGRGPRPMGVTARKMQRALISLDVSPGLCGPEHLGISPCPARPWN